MNLFGNEKIMALSWKQPYAELMLHGKIETRTWSTNYRGLVLICASQKGYGLYQMFDIAGEKQMLRITDVLGRNNDHWLNNYRSGIAIAVGRLVDCRPMTIKDEDMCFVKYREPWQVDKILKNGSKKMVIRQLYCHIYEDVRAIKPFEWKGAQGWKKVEQSIIDKIEIVEPFCKCKGGAKGRTVDENFHQICDECGKNANRGKQQ